MKNRECEDNIDRRSAASRHEKEKRGNERKLGKVGKDVAGVGGYGLAVSRDVE